MSDPNFYRYYDCNIQCPKMKARTMRADTLLASSVETTDIDTQSLTTTTLEATTITAGSINTNAISGDLAIDKLEADEICSTPGNVCFYSGSSALATTHTITATQLPHLANPLLSGTMTFYLENDVYINTTMAAVVKTKGVIVQTLVYQKVGNFTSVDMTSSGNNQLVVTVNPAARLRWIFMGV